MKSARIYLPLLILILLWWYLAFRGSAPHDIIVTPTPTAAVQTTALSPISRDLLHRALLGDSSLMASMIAQWEAEGHFLRSQGYSSARCLSPNESLRAQQLAQHQTSDTTLRFLPQTFASAGFLLALVEPQQIVALPQGLRDYTDLFPASALAAIPQDVGPYHTEKLSLANPHIAFIAAYSLPTMVEALRAQGITLYSLDHLETPESVQQALMDLGICVRCPEKAELMALFIRSALNALDNRLLEKTLPRTLYVNYCTCFSTPTSRKLSGQLLKRLGILHNSDSDQWSILLDQEKIRNLNPEVILLSSPEGAQLVEKMRASPAFQSVAAIRSERVYVLNEKVQEFPSQFVVLAYFDIVDALLRALES